MGVDHLHHISNESARFAHALAATHPDAPVPTCPDWTTSDLLWHLAEVQHFWADVVGNRRRDLDGYTEPARPAGLPGLREFFDLAHASLMSALRTTDADVAVWTWYAPDCTAGFVRRRQAHEALIHRIDAELAAGVRTPVDPALATDGVLELLEVMIGGAPPWADQRLDGPVGIVRTTDTAAHWLVRLGQWSGTSPQSGTVYRDEPMLQLVADGEPSFELSGTAAALDAWLWRRGALDGIHQRGDAAALETLGALVAIGIE